MTSISTLVCDKDGKLLTLSWGDWEPTCELRLFQSERDDAEPPVLQQLFRRTGISSIGHLNGAEQEWRSVEIVYG